MAKAETKSIEKLELTLKSEKVFDISAGPSTLDGEKIVKVGKVLVETYLPKNMYGRIFIKKVYDKEGKFLRSYVAHKEDFEDYEFSNIRMLFEILNGEFMGFELQK